MYPNHAIASRHTVLITVTWDIRIVHIVPLFGLNWASLSYKCSISYQDPQSPDPDPAFCDQHSKILQLQKEFFIIESESGNILILLPFKLRQKPPEPQRDIQLFKTRNFSLFPFFGGSFWPFWIRNRIPTPASYGIHRANWFRIQTRPGSETLPEFVRWAFLTAFSEPDPVFIYAYPDSDFS